MHIGLHDSIAVHITKGRATAMIRVSGRVCWVQLVSTSSSVASSAGWNSLSAYKSSIASSIAMRRYKDLLHAGYLSFQS